MSRYKPRGLYIPVENTNGRLRRFLPLDADIGRKARPICGRSPPG